MTEALIRFVAGGTIVSLFALLGDILRPKGFAGLFAAAPSVALATLSLTAATRGASYAAVEARSMMAGAVALIAYSGCCLYFLAVRHTKARPTALLALVAWAAVAIGIYCGALTSW